ncbi:histidine phosphatase superfamily [Penicillium riverlandense]|uniref:histidine phosphatase superfamily n=1 Tax=Penicillium riverlandense TaxID=1903569 RepID=UPI002548F0ED|nr:histidine phosphatase superfamily [Penicillium riverlandense]KAJ5825695.1 histidine phosphatase superfamily [Penicillium riverlandense]
MSSKVFLIRHGETEWSLNQQHTGSTEVPLTSNGEEQVRRTARTFVGDGKMIQPKCIKHIERARRTLQLLGLGDQNQSSAHIIITELLQEWDYGDYEGLTIDEMGAKVESKSEYSHFRLSINQSILISFRSPQDVAARLDKLIGEIREFNGADSTAKNIHDSPAGADIVCVAHGHILPALALRWAEQPLQHGMRLLLETAGVGVLCFEHESFEEPAVVLGARAE